MLRVLEHKGAASAGVDLWGRLCFFCFPHVIREIAHRVGSCAFEAEPSVDGLSCNVEPGGTFEGCTHTRQRRRAALSSLLSTATVHRDYKGLLPHRDSTKCQPWPESAYAPQNKKILLSALSLEDGKSTLNSPVQVSSLQSKIRARLQGTILNLSCRGRFTHSHQREVRILSLLSLSISTKRTFPPMRVCRCGPICLPAWSPKLKVRLGLLFKKWLAHRHSFSYLTNAWIHFLLFSLVC